MNKINKKKNKHPTKRTRPKMILKIRNERSKNEHHKNIKQDLGYGGGGRGEEERERGKGDKRERGRGIGISIRVRQTERERKRGIRGKEG